MQGHKLREQLVLKPVTVKYLDQYNELLRYVFQVTNQELEESGYEDGEIVRAKRPVLQKSEVLGWFNGERLISQICIYPCMVNIHGKLFQMGGLTGVGTYPEYTNMGLMNDLIKVGLSKMREKKQWISYLYPYSIPYYRRKGWEIISEHLTYTLKDTQIPTYAELPGYVERVAIDDKDVIDTYDRFARSNHGAMIREKLEWDEYWRWENEEERNAAVYYDGNSQPMGYIMYWIEDDVFHIKEFIYLNQEARKGLWNFIHAHDSMIDKLEGNDFKNEPIAYLLQDSQIVESIEPYFMGRIVDVEAFLKEYPFAMKGRSFYFEVTDPIADWNCGVFGVRWTKDGQVEISREKTGKPVRLTIQTLTAMLMGFRRPSYFYKVEHLHTDPKTLKMLENSIPNEIPYFSDYF